MGDSQGVEVTEHSILFQSKLLTAEAIPAADSCNLNHCAFHLQDSGLKQHRLLDWLLSFKRVPTKQTLMKHYLEGLHYVFNLLQRFPIHLSCSNSREVCTHGPQSILIRLIVNSLLHFSNPFKQTECLQLCPNTLLSTAPSWKAINKDSKTHTISNSCSIEER